ncbi:MAG TPA: DPP IV N-terminal domain-containing protein, partial [Longimicrobiales bacterium]|nr:DPP IV N-terminal domain-containing protein [Longimicrobiales bacterium]
MARIRTRLALVALGLLVASAGGVAVPTGKLAAQQPYRPAAVTAQDYARAEGYLAASLDPLVLGGAVTPRFFDGDRFWYRNAFSDGFEYVTVDPQRGTRARAFDHAAMARALSAASGRTFAAFALPDSGEVRADGVDFTVGGRRYRCDLSARACAAVDDDALGRNYVVSPDGTRAAFRRDENLWVRDVATGRETQLTTDGIEDYGYATDNAGWTKSDRPVVLWSPDSRKIATFQHDGRGVGDMYLVSTVAGHPKLEAWRYPLPEDTVIFRISRVVVHLDGPRVVRLKMPPDQHRSTICDHIMCGGTFSDVEWSPDSRQLAFVSSSRDHKSATLRMADPETGDVRTVMNETVETFFESGFNKVNWHLLADSREALWYSQRDDWGHLYLYDLDTGRLKRQITQGSWNVLQVLKVDEKNRTLYFTGAGREPGDPYFQYFYSVGLDRGDVRLLTPDSANHTITMTPSGEGFVDVWSTPVVPPTSVVRDLRGRAVVTLEKADITRLKATGWQPPEPFIVKARDGATDLYGLL